MTVETGFHKGGRCLSRLLTRAFTRRASTVFCFSSCLGSCRTVMHNNCFYAYFSISNFMFRYFGHGTGREFLQGDDIQRLDCRAVTLLMGCSSGKLTVSEVVYCANEQFW